MSDRFCTGFLSQFDRDNIGDGFSDTLRVIDDFT